MINTHAVPMNTRAKNTFNMFGFPHVFSEAVAEEGDGESPDQSQIKEAKDGKFDWLTFQHLD